MPTSMSFFSRSRRLSITIELNKVSYQTSCHIHGIDKTYARTVLPAPAIQELAIYKSQILLRVIIRIPGHHRVLPDPENQSLNSLESSIHFPVPSWCLLKTSFCFVSKCKGDSQATISRLSLSMTILVLPKSRKTRIIT